VCVCVRERERERKEYVYVERESQNKGWHAPHYASHTMCCTTHYYLPENDHAFTGGCFRQELLELFVFFSELLLLNMCICVRAYMYMYAFYICTFTHVCTFTHLHAYIGMHINMNTCTYIYVGT
jgi:hypothetical protein